jgi:hypothetical protein
MKTVYVLASNPALRQGLLDRLSQWPEMSARVLGEHGQKGGIVVTVVNSCTPEECARLTELGFRVIILAPVLRPAECRRYADAGASSYLPMALESAQLDALRAAIMDHTTDPLA